jgi:sarcosine oxidase subunit delta
MTLKVTCPHCGPRYTTEFWFGGALAPHAARAAPAAPGADALRADFDRVWLRDNVAGVQGERWFHHAGCRRWLVVDRDTRTNEFHDHV